jgi:aminopeptidase N
VGWEETAGCAGVEAPARTPGETTDPPPAHWPPDLQVRTLHTRLDIRVDPRAQTLEGVATHRLVAVAPSVRRVALDLCELTVDSVRSGKETLAYHHEGGVLDISFPRALRSGREVEISIAYRGSPRTGLNFTGPDQAYPERPYQAWSQGQHDFARYWFPCHDAPNNKQSTEMVVTVPEGFTAISNGRLVGSTVRGGWRRWHWSEVVPHASYLVTLVVGVFDSWEGEVDGTPLHYYVPPGRLADGHRCFDETPAMVRVIADLAGTPYPFEKYASVVVQDFTWGGMENTSATTFNERILTDERAVLDHEYAGLVSHELAHQWFGDLVTCRDWSHGWLNEGFATFAWPYYAERAYGVDESERLYWQHAQNVIGAESAGRRPTVSNRYNEAVELFDSRIYDKGAWVLRMLRGMLGDDTFFAAVHEYVRRHAGGLAVTDDFIRAVEDTSGRSLGWFFDQWVFGAGIPRFEVRHSWDGDRHVSVLDVRQVQLRDELTRVFRAPLTVEFGLRGRTVRESIEVGTDAEQSFAFSLPSEPAWVRFDAGNRVLKTLSFSVSEKMRLAQLKSDDMLGRCEALLELGSMATEKAVDAVARAMQNDGSWFVQTTAAQALGRAQTADARAALLKGLRHRDSRVRSQVAGALGGFAEDEEVARALTRTLARDESYFAAAAAAHALGRVGGAAAVQPLIAAIGRPSHADVISESALRGLAATGRPPALPAVLDASSPGRPPRVRATALGAAAELARRSSREDRERVARVAERSLRDPLYFVRRGAIGCLGALRDPAAIPALEAVLDRDLEAGVRSDARGVIESLRGDPREADLNAVRAEVEGVRKQNIELRRRLEIMEVHR